jgi:outer membrane biosynthesis protein TonB
MARSRPIEAPAKNDIYVGMWFVAFLATALSVLLLCLELTDYGWDSKPAAAQAPTLVAIPGRTVAPGGTSLAEPEPKANPVVEAAKPEPKPEPAPLALPPAPIPPTIVTQKPEPKSEPKPAEKPTINPQPTGPAPGGFEIPRRR